MTPRILIVAENASAGLGGEAILPLHYFRLLRQRGVDAHLVVNVRSKSELDELFPGDRDRIHYIANSKFRVLLDRLSQPFPGAIKHFTFRLLSRLLSGRAARRLVSELIRQYKIEIVHQPTPVSPKEASMIYGVGAPVVMGPMNGGITYPPGFEHFQRSWIRAFISIGRSCSQALHWIFPGKLRAKTLLVANPRTAAALPRGIRGQVQTLVENGVDLSLWQPRSATSRTLPVQFIFSGRLEDWKGVQYLLQAFAEVIKTIPAHLHILGNGKMREALEFQAEELHLGAHVTFHGWLAQPQCAAILGESDIFVLPSLYECGGAVVLEAMAVGLPVIATNWGGPADYVDAATGILIDPESPEAFPRHLAMAMLDLAQDEKRRAAMSQAAVAKAASQFDWQRKIDQILEIYIHTLERAG